MSEKFPGISYRGQVSQETGPPQETYSQQLFQASQDMLSSQPSQINKTAATIANERNLQNAAMSLHHQKQILVNQQRLELSQPQIYHRRTPQLKRTNNKTTLSLTPSTQNSNRSQTFIGADGRYNVSSNMVSQSTNLLPYFDVNFNSNSFNNSQSNYVIPPNQCHPRSQMQVGTGPGR